MLYRILNVIGRYVGKPPGYERLVRLFCPPEAVRGRPVELLALRDEPLIMANPRTQLGWKLLLFGDYEPELRAYFRNFLRPGFVVVDVGANIGWHTLLMAQRVGDQGRVIAFEPNPSVRLTLQYHVSLNRFRQVEILPYALSDRAGHVQFNAPPADGPHDGDGCLVNVPMAGMTDRVEVEATPFDALLDRLLLTRLDLIKLDVEGFEWPALRGCELAITRFRPHIVFEFIREYLVRGGGSQQQFVDFFRRHRYQLFIATRWGLVAAQDGAWPDAVDIWAVPLPTADS